MKIKILSLPTNKKKGFTLIELMIAISIVAILATIGFTAFSQSQLRARDARRKQDLRAVSQAMELYYQQNRRFPCSGATAVQNSVSGSWLVDVSGCGTFTPTGDITPRYLNAKPLDPVNIGTTLTTATNYFYSYYSINANGNSNTNCPVGSYFVLTARLENTSDKETIQNRPALAWCGSSNFWIDVAQSGTQLSGNSFVIVAP